ncbi:MAG: type II toxin-antitoxin system PemK/MazF family toxin [Anaerolineales bacterium]
MKAGDIVLIRFPQADLEAGKLRPALVVAIAPDQHEGGLLALITSRLYQAIPEFDEIINENDDDYSDSGLKKTSVIRLARLASVEKSVIAARLGNISEERLRRVRDRLTDWLKE